MGVVHCEWATASWLAIVDFVEKDAICVRTCVRVLVRVRVQRAQQAGIVSMAQAARWSHTRIDSPPPAGMACTALFRPSIQHDVMVLTADMSTAQIAHFFVSVFPLNTANSNVNKLFQKSARTAIDSPPPTGMAGTSLLRPSISIDTTRRDGADGRHVHITNRTLIPVRFSSQHSKQQMPTSCSKRGHVVLRFYAFPRCSGGLILRSGVV